MRSINNQPHKEVAVSGDTMDSQTIDRRAFLGGSLRLGVAGAATLSVVGAGASLSGCGGNAVQTADGFSYLRPDDVVLFSALCPVVLSRAAQEADFENTVAQIVQRIDALAFNLDAPNRKTVYQLLDLLNMRVTRWLTTGIGANWQDAAPEDIAAFLAKWRDSSIGLFNVGYRALTKFVSASYFSLPDSRAYTGYPGPQPWALQATRLPTPNGGGK